jgi:hypothetical protein
MISLRAIGQAAVLVLAAALTILLSPPPPEFQRPLICADVRFIGSYAHILVNCDADSFIAFAEHPSKLLEKGSTRQTRPGYAVLGHVLSIPFSATERVTGNPYYAGYVALNFLLLIGCVVMLRDLIGVHSLLAPSAIVPVAILLVNHITKAFLWTPHTQMMGLFISMLSVWIGRRVIDGRMRLTLAGALVVGSISGLACLIYGAFLLVPASITTAAWILARGKRTPGRLVATCVLWLSTVMPLIAWRSFVIWVTGSFYSHETEYYHEFVWIREQWQHGRLFPAFLENLTRFAGTFPRALALPLAFLAAMIALAISRGRIEIRKHSSIQAAGVFLVTALAFYGLMGLYDPRLTATLIPPLIVIAGTMTRKALDEGRTSSILPEPVTIAAYAYAAIVIIIPGPYA